MEGVTAEQLAEAVRRKIRRPLHAVLVGDHLTGVAVDQAAYVLAGTMLVPIRELLGLRPVSELKERQVEVGGWQVQLRFHDLKPALDRLLRAQNTEALEELFSPHVVMAGPELDELKRLARSFCSRSCYHDYVERARPHVEALEAGGESPLGHALEAVRLYLTGRRFLETGEVESHLERLAVAAEESWLQPFLGRQRELRTRARLAPAEAEQVLAELERLGRELQEAHRSSPLPEAGGSVTSLDELLVELRLDELRGKVATID